MKSTTILGIKLNNKIAIGGDGQVTLGNTVIKSGAKKIRKLYEGKILAGFAGSTADAFTLFEKLEGHVTKTKGNLTKAAVDFTKEWRSDKYLRRLEAMLIVADKSNLYILSGNGDVVEPDDGIAAIGSGGPYAMAAALAMKKNTDLDAGQIVKEALHIAAGICIYTNDNIIVEEL